MKTYHFSTIKTVAEVFVDLMHAVYWTHQQYVTHCDKTISEYHSLIPPADQKRIYSEFAKSNSTIRCIVSTVAFGLGVDIADIRLVIHWGDNGSILSYWQEIGRAGRDGKVAEAHMFHRGDSIRFCSEDLKELIGSVKKEPRNCFRLSILKKLHIEGMPKPSIQQHKDCSSSCSNCSCAKCRCCFVCRNTRPCVSKD